MTPQEIALAAAHQEVKEEINRTNTKTSLLLAFIVAVFAGAWTVGREVTLTTPARVAGGGGIALLVGAVALLLHSVRPNLRGGHGFPLWATLTPQQIQAMRPEDLAADIVGLSRIALAKFQAIKRAVDLTRVGGALFLLAGLLTITGPA